MNLHLMRQKASFKPSRVTYRNRRKLYCSEAVRRWSRDEFPSCGLLAFSHTLEQAEPCTGHKRRSEEPRQLYSIPSRTIKLQHHRISSRDNEIAIVSEYDQAGKHMCSLPSNHSKYTSVYASSIRMLGHASETQYHGSKLAETAAGWSPSTPTRPT